MYILVPIFRLDEVGTENVPLFLAQICSAAQLNNLRLWNTCRFGAY